MQLVLPFQTRGAVQQFATLTHVRQVPGVVSQVVHGEIHALQTPVMKTNPGKQQLSQVTHSPELVHVVQTEGHSIQVILRSHIRGAVQQLEVLLSHVRQLVAFVSQVAHGEVHRVQVFGTVKT